ncbi:hypothetical protein AVEN_158486-1 [Araneus ventricosus]|uniref:Uncharacterized protein n=1 Tax=Araneus ventricosus TaxID=182803 RepID=A0A4Y2SN92_ARAVE|nr:hypothetical protein AVEN_158486-1 [Araneus ventricosus]
MRAFPEFLLDHAQRNVNTTLPFCTFSYYCVVIPFSDRANLKPITYGHSDPFKLDIHHKTILFQLDNDRFVFQPFKSIGLGRPFSDVPKHTTGCFDPPPPPTTRLTPTHSPAPHIPPPLPPPHTGDFRFLEIKSFPPSVPP